MQSRELIYSSLFQVLQGLNPTTDAFPGDGTLASPVSRRLRPFTQVALQPALFMLETGEDATYQLREGPRTTHLTCSLVLYTRHDDPNEAPGPIVNDLIDHIEYIVRPGPREQNLGGLVSWVRFAARTTIYEGDSTQQTMTVMGWNILSTV